MIRVTCLNCQAKFDGGDALEQATGAAADHHSKKHVDAETKEVLISPSFSYHDDSADGEE